MEWLLEECGFTYYGRHDGEQRGTKKKKKVTDSAELDAH